MKSGAAAPHSKTQARIGREDCGHVLERGGLTRFPRAQEDAAKTKSLRQ